MSKSIGENIRRLRMLRGLSQKELAEKIGVANVQLNYYEHDTRRPKVDTLKRIADALGVSLEILLGEDMSEAQAKKRLYMIFSQFDGQMAEIDGKTLLWFNKLDLLDFYRRYQIYRTQVMEAEDEKNPEERERKKKAARDSFEEWIVLSGE
jgi:transcriptional regulator with XRE-family HTH domain